MNLDVIKVLIQSACANGQLTENERKHLLKKAKLAKISTKDLDFLIKNELKKVKNKTTSLNQNLTNEEKSGFETYNKSGFVSLGSITDDINEKDDFTNITKLNTRGSMSDILKAKYFGKWVAIKAIKQDFKENPKFLELFNKEFANAFELEHPNIVRLYGKSKDPKDPYYFMEFIDGQELSKIISNEGIKSGALIKKIIIEILSALDYCHKKQIFHRDLKPENVLLTHKGDNVKLIDFGLAVSDNYTDDLIKAGTPAYMSPEHKTNAQKVDGRSDIYSLGKLILKMLSGNTVYENSINSRSPKLAGVIKKCIEEKPSDRYSSASDLLYEIKNIQILDLKFDMRLSSNKVNFGTLEINEDKTAEIKIINRGIGTLNWKIDSKIPKTLDIQIKENVLRIKPICTEPTKINEKIIISSNGGNAELIILANVIGKPKLATDISNIEIKSLLDKEKTIIKRIEIKNIGTGKLEWTISDTPKWINTKAQKNHIYIEFTPTKYISLKGGIQIKSNGGNLNIPISISVNNGKTPILDVSPTQIHFEDVHVGELKEAIIDVENSGAGDLQWRITKSSDWFSIKKLDSGLKVRFVPTRLGTFAGNIVLKSNASDRNITISASVVQKIGFFEKNKKYLIYSFLSLVLAVAVYAIPYKNIYEYFTYQRTEKLEINKKKESSEQEKIKPLIEEADETVAWKNAKKENTFEAYTHFLELYPESEFNEKAQLKMNEENIIWQHILKVDDKIDYYKFIKKFPKSVNFSRALRLFNYSDTSICFSLSNQKLETEEMMIKLINKEVKGRLMGNSNISDSLWVADIVGTRKNDTLLINQTNFSGYKTRFILILNQNNAIKVNLRAKVSYYNYKKCLSE